MLENSVTTFVISKGDKKLSSRRVLYHLPERMLGYDTSNKKVVQTTLSPVSVALCPTPACVRNCVFCSNKERNIANRAKSAEIKPDMFLRLLRDLTDMGVSGVSVAGGGEPFAYKGPYMKRFVVFQNNNLKKIKF